MNTIDSIVIHCSATKEGQNIKACDIDRMHRQRGFDMIGYNYVIDLDGTVELGRPLTRNGAHCNTRGLSYASYNRHSIGICYVGGVDKNLKAKDTRTFAQKQALKNLIAQLCMKYPITEIIGHRDASPDLNGDGEIEPYEWIKQCPCFEVKDEFPSVQAAIIK